MSRQSFSPEQQEFFRRNPYIYSATKNRITFTKEFKEIFWSEFQSGISPRFIFSNHGIDPELLGDSRVRSITKHIREEIDTYGEFHQGYLRTGKYSSVQSAEDPLQNADNQAQLKRLQHEVDYLKQEIEFLKKISSIRNIQK